MERACALLESDRRRHARAARSSTGIRHASSREPLRLRRATIDGVARRRRPRRDVDAILETLGFTLREATDGGWDVTVPTRRVDVPREVDLIEEVARHYGFDKLPSTFPGADVGAARRSIRASAARGICAHAA